MNETPADTARACLLAAIRAADPRTLTARALSADGVAFAPRSVRMIAVGKAAVAMVQGARDALGEALRGGVMIAPARSLDLPPGVGGFVGGHPMPTAEGADGAEAIEELLDDDADDAEVLALISGGASALMTLPVDGITLEEMVAVSGALMRAGADIRELNCVRKHLDRLKGGRMAERSAGARIHALILSDVIGDPLDVIGSGPLVPDPTTYEAAIDVLRRRAVWDVAPLPVREHLLAGSRGEKPETPKAGNPCFDRVEISVIGNNALAVRGAADEARRRGGEVSVWPVTIEGEARVEGARFARAALEMQRSGGRAPWRCVVGGGETTVTVHGSGIGGRNLEFAAAAALVIEGTRGIAIGSIGTDGRDGPTDAAGAVVDGETARAASDGGAAITAALVNNDSLAALDAAGAVIRTGATGTNVIDVQIAIVIGET